MSMPNGSTDLGDWQPRYQLHLPIDSILPIIRKSNPYLLGFAIVGNDDRTVLDEIVQDLSNRLCEKTDRKTLVIRVRPTHLTSDDACVADRSGFQDVRMPTGDRSYSESRWRWYGDSKTDKILWNRQLAAIPGWCQEYGIILFDLGEVSSPTVARVGKLCNGIVVQLLTSSNPKETIRTLKRLKDSRLNLLGVWSVEQNQQKQVA